MTAESDESEAPGWDAIDAALKPLYADQKPRHYAPVLPAMLGGSDPLQGISAYEADPNHWHFVTYGFSDLYDKSSPDSPESGYGFELTFRLERKGEDQPPSWCFSLLQNLARYVFSSGNVFAPGHYMNLNGPIQVGANTDLHAALFIEDPQLAAVQSVNGSVRFLQLVGITLDEAITIKRWDATKFCAFLLEKFPLAITDLDRKSLLSDPIVAAECERRLAVDGSSASQLFIGKLSWEIRKRLLRKPEVIVTVGANGVRDFGPVLKGRVPFGRELSLSSKEAMIVFEPGDTFEVEVQREKDFEFLVVSCPGPVATRLADLIRPIAGTYTSPELPDFKVIVERTEIKDPEGNVVETIG